MDLPDLLELPLTTGAPWWYWLGGRPALDFVNTFRERWNRRVETLVTPQDLTAWLVRAGLLAPDDATAASADRTALLGAAREMREAVDRCVTASLGSRPPAAGDLALIDALLPDAVLVPRLTLAEGRPRLAPAPPADPVRHALALVAQDAAVLLADDAQRARLRICASDTCSARFYDRSPAGRRRWCSMDGCGNVAKARRHRARHRP